MLIVEDIIDTGRTLHQLHTTIIEQEPRSVTTATLVNKTIRREAAFEPDHAGFTITDEFIYGYGLDWNQQYRDLPYIAIANLAETLQCPPDLAALMCGLLDLTGLLLVANAQTFRGF